MKKAIYSLLLTLCISLYANSQITSIQFSAGIDGASQVTGSELQLSVTTTPEGYEEDVELQITVDGTDSAAISTAWLLVGGTTPGTVTILATAAGYSGADVTATITFVSADSVDQNNLMYLPFETDNEDITENATTIEAIGPDDFETQGPYGNSKTFDGSSNNLKTGLGANIAVTEKAITTCLWLHNNLWGKADIFSQTNGGGQGRSWLYTMTPEPIEVTPTTYHLGSYLGGAPDKRLSNGPLLGEWQFVAMLINPATNTLVFYVGDGDSDVSPDTIQIPTELEYSAGNLIIGATKGQNADFFDGLMDEVSVYNRLLSTSEINEIKNGFLFEKYLTTDPDKEYGYDPAGYYFGVAALNEEITIEIPLSNRYMPRNKEITIAPELNPAGVFSISNDGINFGTSTTLTADDFVLNNSIWVKFTGTQTVGSIWRQGTIKISGTDLNDQIFGVSGRDGVDVATGLIDTNNKPTITPTVSSGKYLVTVLEPTRYSVFDLSGKMIKNGNITTNQFIDITGQNAGMYFIKINNEVIKVIKN